MEVGGADTNSLTFDFFCGGQPPIHTGIKIDYALRGCCPLSSWRYLYMTAAILGETRMSLEVGRGGGFKGDDEGWSDESMQGM